VHVDDAGEQRGFFVRVAKPVGDLNQNVSVGAGGVVKARGVDEGYVMVADFALYFLDVHCAC